MVSSTEHFTRKHAKIFQKLIPIKNNDIIYVLIKTSVLDQNVVSVFST